MKFEQTETRTRQEVSAEKHSASRDSKIIYALAPRRTRRRKLHKSITKPNVERHSDHVSC